MLSRIKNILSTLRNRGKRFEEFQRDSVHSYNFIKENQQIHFDYNQISNIFSDKEFIPLTNWSISPSAILHIFNEILLNEKKNLLEFGSGSSTLYIAKFLKINGFNDVKFFSIESDTKWIEKILSISETYGVREYINLIYVPISNVDPKFRWKNQTMWYNTEQLEKYLQKIKFDLVVVDGPWNGFSPFSRYSAIPFLLNNLSRDASIFLDDTNRPEEFEISNEWKNILKFSLQHFNRYSLLSKGGSYNVEPFSLNTWKK